MCGICGACDAGDGSTEAVVHARAAIVAQMNEAIRHRGPDDAGQFNAATCSLAMRRLAIIDLAGGHQPMSTDDGELTIVFNGEVYNFQTLRSELQTLGHVFHTHSDTEVVLHAVAQFGEDAPRRLEGMFAFCVYRRSDRSLFLARDRFGEKPLFYAQREGLFAFSSEIASLLEHPAIERRADVAGIHFYLRRAIVPAPATTFAGMKQLPPGHQMTVRQGDVQVRRYFRHEFKPDPALDDELAATEAVRETLLDVVRRQMVSDVPFGAFLSGGIDSSAVVAAMQRQSSKPIKTFNVRFEEAKYDESPIARRVAEHLGTEHHEFVVTNSGFQAEDLWRIVRHVGMPFVDSSAIPTYFICRAIRDEVTVCLSGDGGDEMFAGYTSLLWNQQVDRIARFPRPAIEFARGALAAATRLPLSRRFAKLRQARRALEIARLAPSERLWAFGVMFAPDEMAELVQPEIYANHRGLVDAWFDEQLAESANLPRLAQMLDFRDRFTLPDDILMKVDRMSMATSLEVRVPFLDAEMARLAGRMPEKHLIRGGVTKHIVREAVRPWLPAEVFSHPKTGFSIPLHAFQNAAYEALCRDLLLDDRAGLVAQLLNRPAVERIVERGLYQKRDQADVSVFRATHHLWTLVQLAAWARHFRVTL